MLYISSIFFKNNDNYFIINSLILGGSRVLIGLGANSIIGKQYILIYTPKYLLPKLSKIYLICQIVGFILGPGISALLSFEHDENNVIYTNSNCIGYYGVLSSFILLLLNHFYFISPSGRDFSMVINQSKDNNNKSSSHLYQSLIEDDEDEQDREYFKLQKEKNDRRSAGLEPTKSDDVNIEVNDSTPTKSQNSIQNSINRINNIKDDNNEKEDDDTNYNKIMENAGEGVQNQYENYINNVNIGRYSDIDLSKEQKDTIKEIEAKLNEYQEKSNFTYINMVPRSIDFIISEERKTFGYLNKNFLIILLLLLVNSFIKENLIVFSSYLYFNEYKRPIGIKSLLISLELILQLLCVLFIIPFFKVNLVLKKYLKICMIASIVFMIPLSFLTGCIPAYVPIVSIDLLLHKIIEVICSCYLVYLIPYKWKYIHMRASSLPIYLMTIGKLGVCAFGLSSFLKDLMGVGKDYYKNYQHFLTIIALFSYGLLFVVINKSENFRINALSRVLRIRDI